MAWNNSNSRYGTALIALHWLTLALLAVVYALIELRELFDSGSPPREAMKAWHFTLGVVVFLLLWLRLGLRLAQRTPPIEPAIPSWQRRVADGVQIALYLMMAAMPVLGLLVLGADGKTALVNGLTLPALIAPDAELADRLQQAHATIGKLGYALIALHAAAALLHHYVMHDNTLTRMLPFRK